MSDEELELTSDKDLLNILTGVMKNVEKRSLETPLQRQLRLDEGGLKNRIQTLKAIEVGLSSIRSEVTAGTGSSDVQIRRMLGMLSRFESELEPHQRSQLALYDIERMRQYLTEPGGWLKALVALDSTLEEVGKNKESGTKDLDNVRADKITAREFAQVELAPVRAAIDKLKSTMDDNEQTEKTYKKAREELAQLKRLPEADAKSVLPFELSVADADPDVVLLKAMEAVQKSLPRDDAYSQKLLGGLMSEVRVGVLDKSVARKSAALEESIGELGTAGAVITRSFNVAVGVEAGAVLGNFVSASAGIGYGFTVQLKRLANGKYQIKRINEASINAGGKAGAKGAAQANVSLSAGGSLAEWRTYDTLDDLVTVESSDMLNVAMGRGKGDGRDARQYINARRALLQKTVANRDQFVQLLKRSNALDDLDDVRQNLPIKSQTLEHIERVRSTAQSVNLSFSAGGSLLKFGEADDKSVEGGWGAAAKVSVSETRRKDFKAQSYIDDVLGKPDIQAVEIMAADGNLRRTSDSGELKSHTDTKHYYDYLDSRIRLYQDSLTSKRLSKKNRQELEVETQEIQRIVKTDLERLGAEYGLFVQSASQRVETPGLTTRSIANENDSRYREILSARNIKGSDKAARYIKSMSLQYAMLRSLYEASTTGAADPDPMFTANMARFEGALRTPPIELTEKSRRRAFGNEASTDAYTVRNTSISLSTGFGAAPKNSISSSAEGTNTTNLGTFGGLSGKLAATVTHLKTSKRGEPASEAAIIVVNFNVGSLEGSASSSNKIDDNFSETLAGSMALKLLDGGLLRKMPFIKNTSREEAVSSLTKAIMATATKGTGRLELRYAKVDGAWRLTTAASVEHTSRGVSAGVKIPTGLPFNVAISASIAQDKSKPLRVYYGSQTLGSLTDIHRFRHQGKNADPSSAEWDRFTTESRLLERMMESLTKNGERGETASGEDLESVLKKFRNASLDETDPGQWKLKRRDRPDASEAAGVTIRDNSSAGIANELLPWLFELKKAGHDDITTNFIDGYIKHRKVLASLPVVGGPSNPTEQDRNLQAVALKEMANLFGSVVNVKRELEDNNAGSDYIARRKLSRTKLNEHIVKRLAVRFSELDVRVNSTLLNRSEPLNITNPDSVGKLKRRLLQAYEEAPSAKIYAHIKDVMSLEHAVESLDDMTRFNRDDDKEAALARLSDIVDNVFTDHKVYVSELIEGRLLKDGRGKLKVSPIVSVDTARVLTKHQISSDVAQARLTHDSSILSYSDSVRVRSRDSENDKVRRWSKSDQDPDARQSYYRQRRDDGHYPTIGIAEKRKKKKKKNSLSVMLDKVLKAEAEQQQRRRLLAKLKRRKRADKDAA